MSLFNSRFIHTPKNKKFDYVPRYYDPEAEERKEIFEQTIKLERGAFFKQKGRSRLVGAFSEKEIIFKKKNDRSLQNKRTFLLITMLCLPCFYIAGYISSVLTIVGLICLMVLFVAQVNKM